MLTKLKRHFENSFFGNGCTAFDLLIWDCLLKCVGFFFKQKWRQARGRSAVCVCLCVKWIFTLKSWQMCHQAVRISVFACHWDVCSICAVMPAVFSSATCLSVCCRRPSAGRRARCLDVRCLQCCHKSVSVCVGICQLPAVLLSPVTCVDLINMVSRPGHDVVSDANTPKLDRWSWSVVKAWHVETQTHTHAPHQVSTPWWPHMVTAITCSVVPVDVEI